MCGCVHMSGVLLCTVLSALITTVLPMSFTSVEEKNKFLSYEAAQNIAGRSYLIAEPRCEDELKQCPKLVEFCSRFKIVRKKCKDTCGLCRAHSPEIDCHVTEHGCCWDNKTAARGPNQMGCPACRDKYSQCRLFAGDCKMVNIKRFCPVTCGVKCVSCSDDKHQAHVCPLYKQYGFCKSSPDIMGRICKRTCEFCL